ncbi:unnamed protein product [Laminaria digitata]
MIDATSCKNRWCISAQDLRVTVYHRTRFFFSFFLFFRSRLFSLPFFLSRPPSRNSVPGAQSRLFSLLPSTVLAFSFSSREDSRTASNTGNTVLIVLPIQPGKLR